MGKDKLPETISFSSDRWFEDFLNAMEIECSTIAKSSLDPNNELENKRIILYAAKRILTAAGMTNEQMLEVIRDEQYGWNEKKNGRRFELVEKQVDGTLTAKETLELESLTDQMRYALRDVEAFRVKRAEEMLNQFTESGAKSRKALD